MIRILTYAFVLALAFPVLAPAQTPEESGGLLVGFLEETLSGENRSISVTGLEGALSSKATIKSLTISDDEGIWLTISNVVLDWNRLALVRGRFSVNSLSASEITMSRPPNPVETDATLPAPEATPFQVPELPVAITIGELRVDKLVLAEPAIGHAAELTMNGSVQLADGALDTKLAISRLDRTGDGLDLVAAFANETNVISLDLLLVEAAGGLLSEVLALPDRPALRVTAKGEGPVDDFTADISLASDETERLGGQVRLHGTPAPNSDDSSARSIAFDADLDGDITPLLEHDYREFFGNNTQLHLIGRSDPDGRLSIDRLNIESEALKLNGALDVSGEGRIERALLDGQITPPDGAEVVLPMTGERTTLGAAQVSARLETEKGESWELRLVLDRLDRQDLSLTKATIIADGTLDQTGEGQFQGRINAGMNGLSFSDEGLNQAVGSNIALAGSFDVVGDSGLRLSNFFLTGSDYSASINGEINGLNSGFDLDGRASIDATDLSRFSTISGQPLGGEISATLTGNGSPLGGEFDFDFNANAKNLSSGVEQLNSLISGETKLALKAARGTEGLKVEAFRLSGDALSADASGVIKSGDSSFNFSARLDDVARVIPSMAGPLKLKGELFQSDANLNGKVRVDGPSSSFADLSGSLDPEGAIDLIYDATFNQIERFLPEFPGSVSAKGTAQRSGNKWQISSDATGPADITAELAGSFDQDTLVSDISAKGKIQLAAVNRFITPNSVRGTANFDLALKGPPQLSSISGTVTTNGTRIAVPALTTTVTDLGATIGLSEGTANLDVSAGLRAGGNIRVTGPVSLTPPFDSRVVVALQQLVLTDNVSFDSSANGSLTYSGPLAGDGKLSGEVVFGETNINIAALSGSLGAAPIPPISHRSEPGRVRATRDRAGLIQTEKSGKGPDIGLDIRLVANNKVFARGRGLQAELGGDILIRGSSLNVAPAGQIELVRGNLDLLGRRLNLSRGIISLQGKLEPYMEFAATTNTSDGSATLEISGPLTAPEVNVYSEPERPSEEALAMLVFGNQYSELSPLRIAQMAASLAQLSGQGPGATGRAREELGVDTLDVGSDDDGKGQVGVGKYLADGVYTDFSVNTRGDTELNLNLDVTDSLTLKGTVDNTGDTALGIFFERDY